MDAANPDTPPEDFTTGNDWWLDQSEAYKGLTWHAPAGRPPAEQPHASDSPGLRLPDGYMDAVQEKFEAELYLMFKPDGDADKTIWVPVQYLNWGWRGKAISNDGGHTWTRDSGAHTVPRPSFSDTTVFPVWVNIYP